MLTTCRSAKLKCHYMCGGGLGSFSSSLTLRLFCQFFIITPPLLAAYIYDKRLGSALVSGLVMLTIISTAYISNKFSLSCSNADADYNVVSGGEWCCSRCAVAAGTPNTLSTSPIPPQYLYATPWCRVAPYACGILLGLVWYETHQQPAMQAEAKRKRDQQEDFNIKAGLCNTHNPL